MHSYLHQYFIILLWFKWYYDADIDDIVGLDALISSDTYLYG